MSEEANKKQYSADSIQALEGMELGTLAGHRWWSLPELAASQELFVPRNLAKLLTPLIAGELPPEPLEVGE